MADGTTSMIPALADELARYRPRIEEGDELIWAAVAVIVAPDPDALLLMRRAERAGDPWSGQMAFPGGRQGVGDASLLETAIRESHEEVGALLSPADALGALDDVAPRTPVLPPIAVRPYVFALPARPPLTLNREVAATHWVSFDELRRPETRRGARIETRDRVYQVDAYHLPEGLVWGMTERILASLFRHL